jgi:hypothetical protein
LGGRVIALRWRRPKSNGGRNEPRGDGHPVWLQFRHLTLTPGDGAGAARQALPN